MKINNIKQQSGFTIVELLIVIVVIGILAAITLVAYNGIQSRANTTAAQNLANSVAKKAEAYNAVHTQYPTLTQLANNHAPGSTTANSGAQEARLESSSSVSATAPDTSNGKTVVQYVPCGTTGARVHYFDYTANALTTPNATGNKSITIGSGC